MAGLPSTRFSNSKAKTLPLESQLSAVGAEEEEEEEEEDREARTKIMGPFRSSGVSAETQEVSSASASSRVDEMVVRSLEVDAVVSSPNLEEGSTRLRFFFLGSPLNVSALTIVI